MDTDSPKKNTKSLQSKHNWALDEIEKYKVLVDSVQDYAIFLIDPDGRIETWNRGAELNKGYAADEIIGKHFSTFYTQSDKDAKKPEYELEIARQEGRVEDEGWRVRKDGSVFWANVIITALRDAEGDLIGFAKVTRDLTIRKGQEDELRHTNEVLQSQKDELRLLNNSKDEFISLASHQLRTPATGVKQYIGMLIEGMAGDLEEDQIGLLESAYESNERQLRIISDLLKVAQVDAGKISLHVSLTNIGDLIKSVIEEQADTFAKHDQIISFNDPGKPILTELDSGLMRMVLENIVNNASKYSKHGTTTTISVRNTKNYVYIDVVDLGVGVAPQDKHKLFQKFSRIDNPLSTIVGGSGLGLYWAKKIVDLHGGKIIYSANDEGGSTFRVKLPKSG